MLKLELFKVKTNDRKDVRNSLISLCYGDADMNGDNGEEYLWDEAREHGYSNNSSYLADYVMANNSKVASMFTDFMFIWMERDKSYYDLGYEIDFIEEEDNLTVAITYGYSE